MNYHSLFYFKKVAELQHLTKAAEELYVAQPSLSRSISSLEDELGVKLFDRVGKNIVLNDFGRIVLRHADAIFKEEEAIYSEIADYKKEGVKVVRLSMRAGTQHLGELLSGFVKIHPDIKVSTLQGYVTKEQYDKLDFTIFARNRKKEDPGEHLLYTERILVALPIDHPLASHKSIDIHELEGQRFLSLPKGNAMRDLLDEYCHNAGFEPNIFIECDSAETVRKTLRLGGVISLVPEISWDRISTETTVLRPLTKPEGKRYLYLAERNRAYLSDSARLFRKYMLEYFKNLENTYNKKLASSPYGKTAGNKTSF